MDKQTGKHTVTERETETSWQVSSVQCKATTFGHLEGQPTYWWSVHSADKKSEAEAEPLKYCPTIKVSYGLWAKMNKLTGKADEHTQTDRHTMGDFTFW